MKFKPKTVYTQKKTTTAKAISAICNTLIIMVFEFLTLVVLRGTAQLLMLIKPPHCFLNSYLSTSTDE